MTTKHCNIAIIDDDPIFGEFLRDELTKILGVDSKLDVFSDVEPFFDNLKDAPNFYSAIFVDRFLGDYDSVKDQFAKSCRYDGYAGKIVLISSCSLPPDNTQSAKEFNLTLRKTGNMNWRKALDLITI